MRGEFDFIESVRRQIARSQRPNDVRLSIGDDAAVFSAKNFDTVITTDLLVEEVDFRLGWTPPQFLGHKALAVSLSDIAAMGARPRYALLSIGIPPKIWKTKFVDEFYEGFLRLAQEHHIALIGGDTSRTPDHVAIDSIVIGEAKRNRAVRRSGAKAGDLIFVTGALGGAAAGLCLLQAEDKVKNRSQKSEVGGQNRTSESKQRTQATNKENLLRRHLLPAPRVEWGLLLGEKNLATAIIDLSDGLSSDLAHLCRASEVGARIDSSLLPIDSTLDEAGAPKLDWLHLAVHGGEDYELLFTVRPRKRNLIPLKLGGVPATLIGEITGSKKIEVVSNGRARALKPAGFQHFRRA